jgi:hypothetical protein
MGPPPKSSKQVLPGPPRKMWTIISLPYPIAVVPEFWLAALITDRDASALKYLTEPSIEYLSSSEPKSVFKLIFEFSSDDNMENDTPEKTYAYRGEAGEAGYLGESGYDRAIGRYVEGPVKGGRDQGATKRK